jgi:hypothetical protein
VRQRKERKYVAWKDRAYSLKGAIPLPDLHFTERQKGAFHHVLQLILRNPFATGFCADQVPVLHH